MIMSFVARLEASPEGGCSVTVPSLVGCISEGATKEEAIENIKEAYLAYVAAMADEHVAPPKPWRGRKVGKNEIVVELDGDV